MLFIIGWASKLPAWYFHVMIIEQKVEKLKRVAGATSRTGIYTV